MAVCNEKKGIVQAQKGIHFAASYAPKTPWLLFMDDQLIVKETDSTYRLPQTNDMSQFQSFDSPESIISLDGQQYYTSLIKKGPLPSGFYQKTLRQLATDPSTALTKAAFHAFHILHWLKKNKFCGCCGRSLSPAQQELALECPSCKNIIYPRISHAIIVAVRKGNQILLARGSRFQTPMYSTIAGFVEAGETLEDCVKRELGEEVGIRVKNISYFGSQPWPFPDSLMLAFTAEWESGDIKIDNNEILAADWFNIDHLPQIPTPGSIARRLIDSFIATASK